MTHRASEDMKAKMEPIKATKDKLVDALNGKIAEGIDKLDAEEVGEVTDMIKDLAEAQKLCWEACYYKSIVEAMEKSDEEAERMGYDAYRYADGRFAPDGRGTRRGYMPPYMNEPDFWDGMSDRMMGYTQDGSTSGSGNGRSANGNGMNSRQGYTDPIDELSRLWQESGMDDKRRMKNALEEMARTIGE